MCENKQGAGKRWAQEQGIVVQVVTRALKVRNQLEQVLATTPQLDGRIAEKFSAEAGADKEEMPLRVVASSLLKSNVAQHAGNRRYLAGSSKSEAFIHPSSVLAGKMPDWVVFDQVIVTSKTFMSMVSTVNPEWIGKGALSTAGQVTAKDGTVRTKRQMVDSGV